MSTTILLIDDDDRLAALLTEYLSGFGFAATHAPDGPSGLDRALYGGADAVVLDLMLPGMDGLEVCRRIRAASDLPILMLTARGEITDRVAGLELGADDYLPKPFEPRELVARLRALLRRRGVATERAAADATVTAPTQGLRIDRARRRVQVDGHTIDLTALEYELLAALVEQPGRVFDRDLLAEAVHGRHWSAFDRSIDVLVSRLRRKLGDDPKQPRFIRTVAGVGYSLVEPLQ